MSSPEFRALLAYLPRDFADPEESLETTREKFQMIASRPAKTAISEAMVLDDIKLYRLHQPGQAVSGKALILFHGGAFVSCSAEGYQFWAEAVANATGAVVYTVDYRLAPQHRFPAALDDCVNAYLALLKHEGLQPEDIGFIGDSCGGGLVITAMGRLKALGEPLPACGISLSGWLDLEVGGLGADDQHPDDMLIDPEWVRRRSRDYLGQADARSPRASAVYTDLADFPPLFISAGEHEILRAEAERVVDNARAAGVTCELDIGAGMVHGWHGLFESELPETFSAWERVGVFCRCYL